MLGFRNKGPKELKLYNPTARNDENPKVLNPTYPNPYTPEP